MLLACAIDRNYVELAGVMLRSCHINGNIPHVEFLVLGDGLSQKDKHNIEVAAARAVTFIDMTDEMIGKVRRLRTTSYWSRATYGRLILPELLDPRYERLVYLDADTIVKQDISHLFEMPLTDALMAAVPIKQTDFLAKRNEMLKRDRDTPYFNAGVLAVNLKRWNEEGLTQKAFELLATHQFEFLDQDVLNVLATDRLAALDWRWNAQKETDYSSALIVHFIHDKPNTLACQHTEKATFLEYRKETPWADRPLLTKNDKFIRTLKHSAKKRWIKISSLWHN
jgi:lipopolysaccharide biosynthesis glycosyltransferase